MSYTPPTGNALTFDFTGAYTPPVGNNVEINFSGNAASIFLEAAFTAVAEMSATLTTSIELSADFTSVTNMSANIGTQWTQVMYIDNYLILIE